MDEARVSGDALKFHKGGDFCFMKVAVIFALVLFSTILAAGADFSYTSTRKTTGGTMAAAAGNAASGSTKYYYKGRKMKVDNGATAEILDFDARTITTVNSAQKTYVVRSFDDVGAQASQVPAKIEVKETGQKKTVNGFSASELMLTMDVDSPQTRQMGKMQMEMDLWLSPDVPGAADMRAFYQKNTANFPWAAMSGGNQSMTAGIADMQRKIAEMNGVPVEQVVKIRMAGGGSAAPAPATPQMSPAQAAQMQEAMAKLKALQAQGGPAAAAAAQAMARMGNVPGAPGAAPAGGGTSMMEITMDSSDFSNSPIPDSVFAIPAGYQKTER